MNDNRNRGTSKWALIGLFSLIALVLAVGGYWFYRHEAETIRNHQYIDLQVIADLKIDQIVNWRNERIADARLNSMAPFLRTSVAQWLKAPGNSDLKKALTARLKLIKDLAGYQNVILAGPDSRILLTLDLHLTDLEPETKQLIVRTASARRAVFGDFFRCPACKQVHLDVAAPVLDQTGRPLAVLILRTDPEKYLYPLIQSWPTASKSAETLLIRKEGHEVLFLNVLRHRPNKALTLRFPLTLTELPAAQVVMGKTGLFEGVDYRRIKVLAAIRPVPLSPWFMVAKVDRKEILAEAAERARLIGFLTLALIVLFGLGTAFLYKHQGKRAFQRLYQAERERAELLEQARVTLYSIGDAVLTTGPDGLVKQMNPVAEKLTGWTEAQASGRPVSQVFRIVNEETRAEVDNPVEQVLKEGLIVGLANHTLLIAKDGMERPIADSGAPIRNDAGEIIGVVLVFRDQTEERKKLIEHQRAQESLLALSRHQEALLSAIPDIVMEVDENKRYTWANQPGYAFFGPDVIGKEAAFYFEGEQKTYQLVEPLFRGQEDVIYLESWQRRRDGEKRLLAWWCRVLKDEKGAVRGALSSARDITVERQSEEALRQSEEKMRSIFLAAPVGIGVVVDRIFRDINQQFCDMTGYTQNELLGQSARMIYPSDSDYEKVGKEKYALIADRGTGSVETCFRRKDGSVINVLLSSTPIDPTDFSRGVTFTALDITERKRSEEALAESEDRYRKLIMHSPDAIYINQQDRVIVVNYACQRLFGARREEDLLGKSPFDLFHPDCHQEVRERIRRQRDLGETVPLTEQKIVRLDGISVDVEVLAASFELKGTKAIHVILRDISERKRTAGENRRLQEQLQQAQKMESVGRLAGGVAHDFNNLLTTIIGNAQMALLDVDQGGVLSRTLEEIRQAGERAAGLTRQLLAFSRKQVLQPEIVDLNEVVRDIGKILKRLIGEDIELETVLTADLGQVEADVGQMEQVIINLAVNARDAMPQGGKLTIETANTELDAEYAADHVAVTPGSYVVLRISDNGIGMTQEVQSQIFEPFFTTKGIGKGTGLGLATVYGIVKQSRGNIWVYSEEGQGTTIKIYLPRVDKETDKGKEKRSAVEVRGGSETVLVVEDEESLRNLVVMVLKRYGYGVLTAKDGPEALEGFKSKAAPIHLLLTDVVMPRMNGRELAEKLQRLQSDLKVLFMSGYTDNAIVHHGILDEGIAFIQKPFTPEDLARKVREALEEGGET